MLCENGVGMSGVVSVVGSSVEHFLTGQLWQIDHQEVADQARLGSGQAGIRPGRDQTMEDSGHGGISSWIESMDVPTVYPGQSPYMGVIAGPE